MNQSSNNSKNKSVIVMKFLAALLITWSHMESMFPDSCKFLVTGGAIGDGLFFFCSGFTLFLGRNDDFVNWYKRRIIRIYPTIITWAILSSIFFGWHWNITDIITTPQYWFISCIMVYYILLYLIRQFCMRHIILAFVISFMLVCICSTTMLDMEHSMMYAQVSFMRIYYFLFMLMGAIVATRGHRESSFYKNSLLCFLSLVFYYVFMWLFKIDAWWCKFQMFSLIPLLSFIYYAYQTANSDIVTNIISKPILGKFIFIISSLTLEIYLVQYALFTNSYNSIWPLNILILYLCITAMAYVLKCASSIFSQLFNDTPFSWRSIFTFK